MVDFDDDDDDMLDEMARFVEGQDQAIVKDHSGILDEDDESSKKRNRKKQLLAELREDLRDPYQGMTARQRREREEKKRAEELSEEEKARQRKRAEAKETRR